MPTSQKKKEEILDRLLDTQRKAQKLALNLRFAGKTAEARAVEEREQALAKQIQKLLARAMRDWSSGAAGDLDEIHRVNRRLQAVIRDVRKKVATAERITKATKALDDVIEAALEIAKKIA